MSDRIRSITLANPGPVLTTYIVVKHRPTDGEWDIDSVEICADAEGTKCLADFNMDELPRDTQEQIYSALAERDEQRRRERANRLSAQDSLARFWEKLSADHEDSYAVRLIQGSHA